MKSKRIGAALGLVAMLSACGGGGSANGTFATPTPSPTPSPTPTPTPTASAAGCALQTRENWVLAQMKEWYLYPETLPTNLNPSGYTSVEDYLDALTATARAQGRDRYFTYLTSIAEENAYYSSGSSAGFGIRLSYDTAARRVFVAEAFEGAPALAAGIDRGTEILAIGTSASNLQNVSDIITAQGEQGVSDALGPNTAGLSRVLKVSDAAGTRTITVAKADYDLTPVSSRYGAKIIDDGNGHRVGYVNLRTFITPAEPALRAAFQQFKTAGITDVIVDLRYNGGGLIDTAEVLANLMGGGRSANDVIDNLSFRPEKASENTTTHFSNESASIAPTHIAFIGTGGTASASELVVNAFVPYLHANDGLIGTNTYGKPVGQIALDNSGCDDRLRVIAFAVTNANGVGGYYTGLANTVEASCQAGDDFSHPMGDPAESSTRAALDFVEGKSCAPIAGTQSALALGAGKRQLISPVRPNTAQREVPGLF